MRRSGVLLAVAGIGTALAVLRIPSLIEPSWYADEGTYADIGQSLDHGAVLYRDVWDNKPPGMYWVGAAIDLVSPSGHGFAAAALAIAAIATLAVFLVGRRLAGRGTATLAALIFAVLASLPNLDGDLLNAEPVGAALVAVAVLVLLRWRPALTVSAIVAGALVGAAFLFKAVFLVDVVVTAGIATCLALAAGRRPGRSEAREAVLIGLGVLLALTTAAVPLALGGSLSGLVDVLVHSDVGYLATANGGGGGSSGPLALLTAVRLLAVLVAGSWLTLVAARRRHAALTVLSWWLTWDVLGAVSSARGFTHYAQQFEPALALATALCAAILWRRRRVLLRLLAAGTVVLAWPFTELVLLLPRLQVAAVTGVAVLPLERHNFDASQVPGYYAASWRRLIGDSEADYYAIFPTDMYRQGAVIALFDQVGAHQRVFVWGSIHWVYALSGRLPAGRYVTLNSAYYLDAGAQARLLDDLERRPPAILVADATLPAQLMATLQRWGYHRVPHGIVGEDYWLAPTTTAQLSR